MTINTRVARKAERGRGGRTERETRPQRALRHYRDRNGAIDVYIDGVTFGVESGTEADLVYHVDTEQETCECPDSEYKGQACWHQIYTVIWLAKHRNSSSSRRPARKPTSRCKRAGGAERRVA